MEVIMIDKWSFVVQEYLNTENYPTIKEILQNFNKSQNEMAAKLGISYFLSNFRSR